jgi:hypothetical protein
VRTRADPGPSHPRGRPEPAARDPDALGLALGRLGADSWLSWFLGYGFDPERGLSTFRAAPDGLARVAGLGLGLGNLLFPYEIARSWGWIGIAAAVGLLLAGVLGPAWFAALRRRSSDAVAYATMLGANLLFAFWWESRNIEFLLPVAFAATALAGQGGAALRRAPLVLGVAGLVAINAAVAFWPQRGTPPRYLTVSHLNAHESLDQRDLLIAEELNTLRWLEYFHGAAPRFLPGAVSAAMHGDQQLQHARAALLAALRDGDRVYTLERNEHGRLRALAERFSVLGRSSYRGDVESDLRALYDGLTLEPIEGVPGVQRVRGPAATQGDSPRP